MNMLSDTGIKMAVVLRCGDEDVARLYQRSQKMGHARDAGRHNDRSRNWGLAT